MGKQCRFNSQLDANAFASAVDAFLGYPKGGQDRGGGVHAPEEDAITEHYAEVSKHATADLWGYPLSDDVANLMLARPELAPTAVIEEREATWDPPPSGFTK